MFDTMKIAKRIREARIAKNMTQVNLADAMGVSYQAVSNWERGNSMPDISKLAELCAALDLGIQELLGTDAPEIAAVEKIAADEDTELSMEELSGIAPMLPPQQIREQAKRNGKKAGSIKVLAEIAMYLEEDQLEELLEEIEFDSLAELAPIAMYLGSDVLDRLVKRASADDYEGIAALASYLEEETICDLVGRSAGIPDKRLLAALVIYMDGETLDILARRAAQADDISALEMMAVYMEEETLDAVADIYIERGDVRKLSGLFVYMESETMGKIARCMMAQGDIEG